jgi:hypothetical protein
MRGIWYTFMYYVRIVCAFIAPVLIFVAGMAFGKLYVQAIGIEPTIQDGSQMLLIGLVMWGIIIARAFGRSKKN